MAEDPTPSAAAGTEPDPPRPSANPVGGRRPRDDLVLGLAVAAVFVANLVVSFAVPIRVPWSSGPGYHYLVHLGLALTGLSLAFGAAFLALGLLGLEPLPEPSVAFGLWVLAVAAIVAVMAGFRRVPAWRRAGYAYLIGAQLTGFAAVHWSTLGS